MMMMMMMMPTAFTFSMYRESEFLQTWQLEQKAKVSILVWVRPGNLSSYSLRVFGPFFCFLFFFFCLKTTIIHNSWYCNIFVEQHKSRLLASSVISYCKPLFQHSSIFWSTSSDLYMATSLSPSPEGCARGLGFYCDILHRCVSSHIIELTTGALHSWRCWNTPAKIKTNDKKTLNSE